MQPMETNFAKPEDRHMAILLPAFFARVLRYRATVSGATNIRRDSNNQPLAYNPLTKKWQRIKFS